ncbi:hypothetical protein [Algoriphagus sp. A40]|uniref:hypothetical protein n=1 Tax=Algoriphagus sp. A40 TaxID=1945863 RepID=UPI000986242C|nr:hypothetical protein [Algoriphagus sp. A40]OOG78070.1 hypothetical protein B0E43_02875 [Algoriphagus sp. A40]
MQKDSHLRTQFGLISFRFAFIYYLIYFNPLSILGGIPFLTWLPALITIPLDALVYFLNDHLLQIRPTLVPMGGSGDTSFGWAQLCTYLILAAVGALIWTIFDRKKTAYPVLHYWLCLIVRYSLAGIAFSYGILKVFAMQMYFPNLSQLATPLGDYLPMRFSWMFIGYSEPYQIFSGVAEVTVALLLIWRRTALLGALLAIGVFANVAMLNLSYDIPVKIYSLNLLIASIFLVWQEKDRLIAFFIQNKAVLPSSLFEKRFEETWQKTGRFVLKAFFILMSFGFTTYNYYNYFVQYHAENSRTLEPIKPGMYHVELFVKNGDTIPESLADSLRWRDVIFDYNGAGSISANDSSLRMRYGRAHFNYKPDSLGSQLEWRLMGWDSLPLVTFDMVIPEEGRMVLKGKKSEDSLHVVLKKLNRHFPLTERQFHWISESNR